MNCVLEIYVHDVIMTINICGDFLTLILTFRKLLDIFINRPLGDL